VAEPRTQTLRLSMNDAVPDGSPDGSMNAYDVVVCADAAPFERELSLRFGKRPRYLVADETVAALHGSRVQTALGDPPLIRARAGEATKSLREVECLADALIEAGASRDAVVIALGGGALCDAVGFVAASLFRGVSCVYLPTTLLAMVDAAIGGKTAVNLTRGKNLFGATCAPALVICELAMLATLPAREHRAGLAEVLKHALLEGEDALARLQANARALVAGESDALFALVCRAIAFKGRVVAADPHERKRPTVDEGVAAATDGREILNLGHTVAHALEAVARVTPGADPLPHGEAVALGLLAEARLAASLGYWPDGPARIEGLLALLGLPSDALSALQAAPRDVVLRALIADKKNYGDKGAKVANGRLRFVILDAPGRPFALALDGDRALEILLLEKVG
jgi:3-dehydroquinate synthetase